MPEETKQTSDAAESSVERTPVNAASEAVDKKVQQVVANIRNLPTPPMVFTQIQKAINSETASANDVARILSEDPSMSAKVLKMTNSAFYGLAREIDSVQQAVLIIGFEAVKNLVLSASVMDMFKGNKIDPDFQDCFWRHSLATAMASRMFARSVKSRGAVDPEAAFSAGLLHDIGKLVVACFMPEEHNGIQAQMKLEPNEPDFVVEETALGYTHQRLGAALGVNWNLSRHLVDAIAYHHEPRESGDGDYLPHAIYFGNYIAKTAFADDFAGRVIAEPEPKLMAFMDVDSAKLESFVAALREEYSKAQTFLSMA
ncbi:MAG TPA: HDOD domain-containing protein, partial [candidate division Zixibacteria bacterium]|nr:HDOD domain-containing protein [candidate division Zixibacteria bacterium]